MADEHKPGEIFEMFQKMINPMAFPMQNLMMAGLNLEEIERKIGELTTVKHWLNTNASMLELTIKALEYQRALLSPAPKGKDATAGASPAPAMDNPMLNPALWPWSFMGAETQDPKQGDKAPATRKPSPKKS